MKGTCSWNYEFKNQKLVINCNSYIREDAIQYRSKNAYMKLEVIYLNNNYDYMLTNDTKGYCWGQGQGTTSSELLDYKYDVNTQEYKIIYSSYGGVIWTKLPLIKCTVIW